MVKEFTKDEEERVKKLIKQLETGKGGSPYSDKFSTRVNASEELGKICTGKDNKLIREEVAPQLVKMLSKVASIWAEGESRFLLVERAGDALREIGRPAIPALFEELRNYTKTDFVAGNKKAAGILKNIIGSMVNNNEFPALAQDNIINRVSAELRENKDASVRYNMISILRTIAENENTPSPMRTSAIKALEVAAQKDKEAADALKQIRSRLLVH